jgi:hypothetical protein
MELLQQNKTRDCSIKGRYLIPTLPILGQHQLWERHAEQLQHMLPSDTVSTQSREEGC